MSGTSPDSPGAVGRRTVVRAGAWSVPVVAVAAAAPAYACSPSTGLTGGSFAATYVNHATPNTVDPTRIVVTASITNSGTASTVGFTRVLSLPANLFDTVVTTTPTGYAAPTVTGSLAVGWTLVYPRTSQLVAGASDAFTATLTLGGTTASPFRGWQGPAFTLAGQANGGSACGTAQSTAGVQATPNTTLEVSSWRAQRTAGTTDLWVGDDNSGGTADTYVRNTGRKAVGPITLTVTVPDARGRYASVAPAAPQVTTPGWDFVARTPAGNATGPWAYTFRTTGDAVAPDDLNGMLQNDRTPRFRAKISLGGGEGWTPNTVQVNVVASAPGATDSPVVGNNAE
jgi:hypothetical protein